MSSPGEPIECLKCGSENIKCIETIMDVASAWGVMETVDECHDCGAKWSNIWNFGESQLHEEED